MLLTATLPWTGLVPGTIREAWRNLRDGPPSLRLCAVWMSLYSVAVVLSPGDKALRYLLPGIPPFVVLAARFLSGALHVPRRLRSAAAVALLVGIPVTLAAARQLAGNNPQDPQMYLGLILPGIAGIALAMSLSAVTILWGRARLAVAVLAAGMLVSYGLMEWTVMQHWEGLWPWRTVAATVHRRARPGDRVIVFGEVAGESHFARYYIETPVMLAYVAIGVIERDSTFSRGTVYCTLLYFGLDGSTLPVIQTPFGRLGGLICWENYMPMARMVMYSKGVELYVSPTADTRDAWQATIRHISCEGRCFVLSACQFVTKDMYPPDFETIEELQDAPQVLARGGSAIVAPLGDYLAGPLFGEEGILVADLDLAAVVQGRFDFDVAGHYARPDVFRLLVNEQPAPPVQAATEAGVWARA